MMWAALYQQRPAPEEGDYFKAEWLKPYEALPPKETLRVYGGSDYAVTADGGDYTVHAMVGLDPDCRMYLLDVWRKQASTDAWIEAFCDLVLEWKPITWAEEKTQITSGVGPYIDRRQAGAKGVRVSGAISHSWRQSGPSPVDPRSHGHARALCAPGCPMAGPSNSSSDLTVLGAGVRQVRWPYRKLRIN